MLKLYRKDEKQTLYWEAWEHDGTVVVHWGKLGERGDAEEFELEPSQVGDDVIAQKAAERLAKGYETLDPERQIAFIVQYRLADAWGSDADLERRHRIEELMGECLGWTGNGHCDGGDIGNGTMNIWCYVVDPRLAAEEALKELRELSWDQGAIMAYDKDGEFLVIWPPGFSGEFSVI